MTRSAHERARHVRDVLAAARRVVERADALVPAIARDTGLSEEGVTLALREHLEWGATDAEIASLVAHAGDAPRVHVILSANVFVGALRAVAIARAASEDVTVRPSRRDPSFARALIGEMATDAVRLGEDIAPLDVERGEIHVYGKDETIARVRAAAGDAVRVMGHGAGMGIAWIGRGDDLAEAAEAVARDVVPFDQRGCLSPRVALVEGEPERAAAFARALHERLAAWQARVPLGVLAQEERETLTRYIETMTFAGAVHAALGHVVAVAPPGAALAVPPPGRNVHIAPIASAPDAAVTLAPLARAIVAVGANDPSAAAIVAPSHARVSPLGRMQRPALDGPVDLRS